MIRARFYKRKAIMGSKSGILHPPIRIWRIGGELRATNNKEFQGRKTAPVMTMELSGGASVVELEWNPSLMIATC